MNFVFLFLFHFKDILFFIGGIHQNGSYENCTGGITGYIDRIIFTEKHLYQYPTCQLVYGRKI
jgi:heparan-alpha-glucosaminide N-acetyltransferase